MSCGLGQCPKIRIAIAPLLLPVPPSNCSQQTAHVVNTQLLYDQQPRAEENETALMYQIVQLLSKRRTVLLSDLGALLSADMRHTAKEMGGLRKWMQSCNGRFIISGVKGMETVSLYINATGEVQNHQECGATYPQRATTKKRGEVMTILQLRGLPYRATVSDIQDFLGSHADSLQDGGQSIHLQIGRDGRFSGYAYIQFAFPTAAAHARSELHMKQMCIKQASTPSAGAQTRYVEAFLLTDEKAKSVANIGFLSPQTGVGSAEHQVSVALSSEPSSSFANAFDQIVGECRAHMSSPGRSVLLMSVLGSVLSSNSRGLLKDSGHGLMQVLARFPNEFEVSGCKAKEVVTYKMMTSDLASNAAESVANNGCIDSFSLGCAMQSGANSFAHNSVVASDCSDLPVPDIAAQYIEYPELCDMPITPSVIARLSCSPRLVFETPSDWGTPKPQPLAGTSVPGCLQAMDNNYEARQSLQSFANAFAGGLPLQLLPPPKHQQWDFPSPFGEAPSPSDEAPAHFAFRFPDVFKPMVHAAV